MNPLYAGIGGPRQRFLLLAQHFKSLPPRVILTGDTGKGKSSHAQYDYISKNIDQIKSDVLHPAYIRYYSFWITAIPSSAFLSIRASFLPFPTQTVFCAPSHHERGCQARDTVGDFRLEVTAELRLRDQMYADQQTPQWKERYKISAGIEATNSELKRSHGIGKLRVRRAVKVLFAVSCKLIACNVKRWANAHFAFFKGVFQRFIYASDTLLRNGQASVPANHFSCPWPFFMTFKNGAYFSGIKS